MKNIAWSIVTFCTILLINWGLVALFEAEFIEYAFLAGLGTTAIIWFLSSSGGIGSNTVRMKTQAQTGIKIDEEKQTFNPTIVFYTAAIYTIIAAILTFFYYKDYFFS